MGALLLLLTCNITAIASDIASQILKIMNLDLYCESDKLPS